MPRKVWKAIALLLLTVAQCAAEHSNQTEVRRNLASGGWTVIYGDKFTEGDWIAGGMSMLAAFKSGNPQPFVQLMKHEVDRSVNKIKAQLPAAMQSSIVPMLKQSIKNKSIVVLGDFEIQAGIATYDRWDEWSMDVPVFHTPIDIRMKRAKTTVNLPNWHEPYIRFRVRSRHRIGKPPTTTPRPKDSIHPSLPRLHRGNFNQQPRLGIKVARHPRGLRVTSVSRGSIGDQAGLRRGMLLSHVNGQFVQSAQDVLRVLRDAAHAGQASVDLGTEYNAYQSGSGAAILQAWIQ